MLAHAQTYLSTRTTSRAHLSRLLLRRAARMNEACGEEARVPQEDLRAWVEAALDSAERLRLVDDTRFAADRARSLLRRGTSDAGIRAKLSAKGLPGADIDSALEDLGGRSDRALAGALAFSRRRRLGPFREESLRAQARDKDLGALARGGFPWAVVSRVLALSREEAEDLLAGAPPDG